MQQLLTLNNNHVFVCGLTRSGKTYFTKNATAQIKYPVLFFNVQNEDLPDIFLTADENSDFQVIKKTLKAGGHIDFRFTNNINLNQINLVIAFFIRRLMAAGYNQNEPVYVVIDESQLLADEGLSAAIDAATRGLSRGVRLICITQRPALVDKTIYTQAVEQYIFRLHDGEGAYMKNKGLDFNLCRELWAKNGQYSYIFSDGFTLEGRKAI